jgi:hypothetical protein
MKKISALAIFISLGLLVSPFLARAYDMLDYYPTSVEATSSGNSVTVSWQTPVAFFMTTDNGYVVLIHKDTPVNSVDVYLTNSPLLKDGAFEPFGTNQHTFSNLAAGTYYFAVGVGRCDPQEGKPCQWANMGYIQTLDTGTVVTAGIPDTQPIIERADTNPKPDLSIKAAKATLVTRKVNGVSKKQYKIGISFSNKSTGDAVGDITYSFNSNAPVLAVKGGLKAHMSKKVFLYVDPTEKGQSYVFIVDPGNTVAESNENNNTATRVVGK